MCFYCTGDDWGRVHVYRLVQPTSGYAPAFPWRVLRGRHERRYRTWREAADFAFSIGM